MTTTTHVTDQPDRPTPRRSDLQRMFRVAARHSRHVRVLRIVVPAAMAFVVVLVALATWLAPGDTVDDLPDVSGTLTLSGTKLYIRDRRSMTAVELAR